MPLLFSYGTLQQEGVQLSTFGRRLQGEADDLLGFEQSLIAIDDPEFVAASGSTHHRIVAFNGRDDSRVSGMVFEVTESELAQSDRYEPAGYTRIAARLASGREAWVYADTRFAKGLPGQKQDRAVHQPDAGRPERWRLFIAISLPDAVRGAVEQAQAELRAALPQDCVRWARPAQFHLTLKFLGGIEPPRVAALTGAIRRACVGFAALRLRAGGIGFFPNARRPRIVWVGMQDEPGSLPALQRVIEAAAAEFTSERSEGAYQGHVTLGRCKDIKRPQAESLVHLASTMASRPFGEWTADAVDIIRSDVSSTGSRYTTLARVPFGSASRSV